MKTIVSWMDVAVIIGYLLMMIGIGIWSSKKVKNLTDYALAGRKLGYPVMLGTLESNTLSNKHSM